MAQTALERLNAQRESKVVELESDFAGIKSGKRMFVATPRIVADYVNGIPYGRTKTIPEMRDALALTHGADATCPVSTAIFMRIVAEAALEEIEAGKPPSDTFPFWRILSREDKVTKRLPIDGEWIDRQRQLEASD